MPALAYPDDTTLASWDIRWDWGCRDGSSPNVTFGVDNNTATRKLLCKWEHYLDVCKYLVGYSEVWDNSGTPTLSRLLPRTMPGMPWLAITKINSVKGQGHIDWDEEDEIAVFDDAAIEALYEQVPYELAEDGDIDGDERLRYTEFPAGDPEPNAEYLALPGISYVYRADPSGPNAGSPLDGKPIPGNIGRIVPQETFRIGWHRLPLLDVWSQDSALYQRIFGTSEGDDVPFFGAINKAEFFGRAVGTCILTGVKPYRRKGINGTFELDIVYEIGWRPAGWNWLYGFTTASGTASNGFYMVSTRDSSFATANTVADYKSIYCARDLNDLWKVG